MAAQAPVSPISENNSNPEFHDFLDGESSASDCESSISSSSSTSSRSRRNLVLFPAGLAVKLAVEDRAHEVIRRRFLSCLGGLGERMTVVAIHRKIWSGFSDQARPQSFQIHSQAVANKNGGSSNVKFAWYGNGGRERIEQILSHGFGYREVQDNINGAVFLSPDDSPAESVRRSIPDEDGLRHVLLCRVILGRPEYVPPGSVQTHPSSDEFDSGVDGLEKTKKYIIWSTQMNTHILPEYVVSFRAPSLRGTSTMENGIKLPKSPWISFPVLISVLGKFLAQDAVELIRKYYNEHKEKKMTRAELIQKVRQIAGDKLLTAIIKSYNRTRPRSKMATFGFLGNKTNKK